MPIIAIFSFESNISHLVQAFAQIITPKVQAERAVFMLTPDSKTILANTSLILVPNRLVFKVILL